ncbi:hypothetical protein HF888_07745 [Bermanella marisrubri]|uniref:Uncharacterized protein n=1 Tax=Bermanella marisrubri TaxID=207949 RepID=Q1N4Q8_9GAMM|nr:hypothetical protein [Bermanella marisrubri]EAT13370.1 hypothetical protein RED65_01380 [Oceanobacter sp. RED65] [Bermanella marisrubri]QIZ84125.1 hypothetical protein HF888_07745 [Bermanella marisrubri]
MTEIERQILTIRQLKEKAEYPTKSAAGFIIEEWANSNRPEVAAWFSRDLIKHCVRTWKMNLSKWFENESLYVRELKVWEPKFQRVIDELESRANG